MWRATRRTVNLVGALAVSGAATAGCVGVPPEPLAVDWAHPFDGLASPVASAADAVRIGGLHFAPLAPALGGVRPTIWAPHRTGVFQGVALQYRFGASSEHPTAGLVSVAETPTNGDHWRGFVGHRGPAEVSLVNVAGHDGALIQDNGIGRVLFTAGAIDYDITGPAVSPRDVLAIAEELATAAGGRR